MDTLNSPNTVSPGSQEDVPLNGSGGQSVEVEVTNSTTRDITTIGQQTNVEGDATTVNTNVAGSVIGSLWVGGKIEYNLERDAPIREDVDQSFQSKIRGVFVAPASYDVSRIKGDNERRIVVVHGSELSGRYTCAIHLGLELHGGSDSPFQLFRPIPGSTRSLTELIRAIGPENGGVYIVQNVFSTAGITAETFLHQGGGLRQLRDANAWLVVTAGTNDVSECLNECQSIVTDEVNLGAVLSNHAAWYSSLGGSHRLSAELACRIQAHRNRLSKILTRPASADVFCQRISGNPELANCILSLSVDGEIEDQNIEAIQRMADLDPLVTDRWFRGLTRNAQLYAMIIRLFSGVRRSLLERLFAVIVNHLRKQGLGYQDLRKSGFDDLYRQLHVRPDQMEFDHPGFELQVEVQIQNYGHLFVDLLGIIFAALQEFTEGNGASDQWELRQRIGWFIGRYGAVQFDSFSSLMENLSVHRNSRVSVIAGYAAAELTRTNNRYDGDVIRQIDGWAHSEHGYRMRAAVTTVEKLYPLWANPTQCRRPRNTLGLREILRHAAENVHCFSNRFLDLLRDEEARLLVSEPSIRRERTFRVEDMTPEQRAEMTRTLDNRLSHRVIEIEKANTDAISRAVVFGMFESQPIEAVELLREWLNPQRTGYDRCEENGKVISLEDNEDVSEGVVSPKPSLRQSDMGRQKQNRNFIAARIVVLLFEMTRGSGRGIDGLNEKRGNMLISLIPYLLGVDVDTSDDRVESTYQEQYINPVLRVIAGWVALEEWYKRITSQLLSALSMSSPQVRLRLRRGLLQTWLREQDHEIRALDNAGRSRVRGLAQVVLVRERLLNGVVCDCNGGEGVIVVDNSREGRLNKTAADFAFNAYYLLNAQTNLRIAWLGRRDFSDQPPKDRLEMRKLHSHPRLLMPVLESLDEETVLFVLIPHWGQVCDSADILEVPGDGNPLAGSWSGRVIPLPLSGQLGDIEEEIERLPLEWRVLAALRYRSDPSQFVLEMRRAVVANQRRIESLFEQVVYPILEPIVARRLVARSAKKWAEAFKMVLPVDFNAHDADAEAIAAFLNSEAQWLDECFDGENMIDRLRILMSGQQWLASVDPSRAADVVYEWLASVKPGRIVGVACARALIRVQIGSRLGSDKPARVALTPARYARLFRLASLLAQHEPGPRPALEILFQAAFELAADPEWVRYLISPPDGEMSGLLAACHFGSTRPDLREWIISRLSTWDRAVNSLGSSIQSEAVRFGILNLRDRLLAGLQQDREKIQSEGSYGLIVLDESGRLDDIAKELLFRMGPNKIKGCKILLFRVGRLYPVKSTNGHFPPPADSIRPALIGPLLEHSELDGKIRFIVLLAHAIPLDAWESLEAAHLDGYCYFDCRIPGASELGLELISPARNPENVVADLMTHLSSLMEGCHHT
ncbi:MAG: hypothetical protein ACK5EA_26045 [Planctomycetaceae bacterium]